MIANAKPTSFKFMLLLILVEDEVYRALEKDMVDSMNGQFGNDVPVRRLKAILKSVDLEGRTEVMTYTVIYEEGPTSWGAYVPDLPGVISVGDSPEEVGG